MEHDRFDTLVRHVSRRTALGGLAALGVLTALGLQPDQTAAAPCPAGGTCRTDKAGIEHQGRRRCRRGTKRCKGKCIDRKAACPPVPDASCPVGPGTPGGFAWYLHTAQTFTERNGGRLKSAELWMRNTSADATGTYVLRLNNVDQQTGVPKPQATMAAASLAVNQVSNTSLGWVRFTFPNPPQLKPRTKYALVLLTKNGSGFEGPVFEQQSPGPCAGGQFFVSNGAGHPFAPREADIAFRTTVRS